MTFPPIIPNHTWKPLTLSDAPALLQLQQSCSALDGMTKAFTLEEMKEALEDLPPDGGLGLWDEQNRLQCAAWFTLQTLAHGTRAFLTVLVSPEHRPLLEKDALLWVESQATAAIQALGDSRPARLRIDFYDKHPDSMLLYTEIGFHRELVELEMEFPLVNLLPPHIRELDQQANTEAWRQWSPELAGDFFAVYHEAFKQRPNFPNWPQEVWVKNFTGGKDFQPNLSFLIPQQAFIVCHVEGTVGHLTQLGVHPDHRRKNLAGQMIAHCLVRFQEEGLTMGRIEVNLNNIEAQNLYTKLGFKTTRAYRSYQKAL